MQDERRERFDALYRWARARILAYTLRRAVTPEDAADVVAETFTVAWRRLEQVPAGDNAILWLYATARNVLRSEHRRRRRHSDLLDRVSQELPASSLQLLPRDEEGLVALLALRALAEEDREMLMLAAWEGLGAGDIGRVVGCSAGAARVRIHRARHRLQQVLASFTPPGRVGPNPGAPPRDTRRSNPIECTPGEA